MDTSVASHAASEPTRPWPRASRASAVAGSSAEDRDSTLRSGGGKIAGRPSNQMGSLSYAFASHLVASSVVDLRAFPLAAPSARALPLAPSSAPLVEPSLLARLPLVGRFLGTGEETAATRGGSGSEGSSARASSSTSSPPFSPLCCPGLSSLLPNAHVCRWSNRLYLTAWRDATVYGYVLPMPQSCFLGDRRAEGGGPAPRATSFYYAHTQPVGLARLLPEHNLLLVAGSQDEKELDSSSADVFLLQYEAALEGPAGSQRTAGQETGDAAGALFPLCAPPFRRFEVYPSPQSSGGSQGSSEPAPLRIRRAFSLAVPLHGVSLAASYDAGLLLFSADSRKKKGSVIFLPEEALEDLATDADARGAHQEPDLSPPAASEPLTPSPGSGSGAKETEVTAGRLGLGDSRAPSLKIEKVPFSFCSSDHFPTLPSAPTAYALDRKSHCFFVGGFDAEEGRAWLAVANCYHLRPELDEEDYKDPEKLRLRQRLLEQRAREEAAKREGDDEGRTPAEEPDLRPFVILLPLLSCLRYAAKVAASIERNAAEENVAQTVRCGDTAEKNEDGNNGERGEAEEPSSSPRAAVARGSEQLPSLHEQWGAQFYRPVSIAEVRSLVALDVEQALSESPLGEGEEAETLVLSHTSQSARGFSRARISTSAAPAGDGPPHAPQKSSAAERQSLEKARKKLEQDEQVEVVHIAVSPSGRRLAVTFSTREVLILSRQDGATAAAEDATHGPQGQAGGTKKEKDCCSPHSTSFACKTSTVSYTVQPDKASAAAPSAAAPYVPWLFLPAPFVSHLRIAGSLGRRSLRFGSAAPAPADALGEASHAFASGREAFRLVSSLQQYPEYEGLNGLLGCAFTADGHAAGGLGADGVDRRGEEEDVLLLALGVRASLDRLRGLAGYEVSREAAPQARSPSPPSAGKAADCGDLPAGSSERSDAARPGSSLDSAEPPQRPPASHPRHDSAAGLLSDELRPTPSMSVDVCALRLSDWVAGTRVVSGSRAAAAAAEPAAHASFRRRQRPVASLLPNASPQVAGDVQRWLCPCSRDAEALGVALLPPCCWRREEEEESGERQVGSRRGAGAGEANALTVVITLESTSVPHAAGQREKAGLEKNSGAAGEAGGSASAAPVLRVWAVDTLSVDKLTALYRSRSRFAEAERVCANALENLLASRREGDTRRSLDFAADENERTTTGGMHATGRCGGAARGRQLQHGSPQHGSPQEGAMEDEERRQREAEIERYRCLLEEIREERWTHRGRLPGAAEEDFEVFFSLQPRHRSWLVSEALAYDPFQTSLTWSSPCLWKAGAAWTGARVLSWEAEEGEGRVNETDNTGRRGGAEEAEEEREGACVQLWAQGLERLERLLVFLLRDTAKESRRGAASREAAPASARNVSSVGEAAATEGTGEAEKARRANADGNQVEEAREKEQEELRERLQRCRLLQLFCNSAPAAGLSSASASSSGLSPDVSAAEALRPPLLLSTPLQPFGFGSRKSLPCLEMELPSLNVMSSSLPRAASACVGSSSPPPAASSSSLLASAGGALPPSRLLCLSLSLSSLLSSDSENLPASFSSSVGTHPNTFLFKLCCLCSANCRLDCIVAMMQQGHLSPSEGLSSSPGALPSAGLPGWERILSSLPEVLHPVHYAHLLPVLLPPACPAPSARAALSACMREAQSASLSSRLSHDAAVSSLSSLCSSPVPSLPASSSSLSGACAPAAASQADGLAHSFLLMESDPLRFFAWAIRRLFCILKRTELVRSVALPLLHAILSLAVKQRLPHSLRKANRRSRKQALERASAVARRLRDAADRQRQGGLEGDAGRLGVATDAPAGEGGGREANPRPRDTAREGGGGREAAQSEAAGKASEVTAEQRASALAAAVLAIGVSPASLPSERGKSLFPPSGTQRAKNGMRQAGSLSALSPRAAEEAGRVRSPESPPPPRSPEAGWRLSPGVEGRPRVRSDDETLPGPKLSGSSTVVFSDSLSSEKGQGKARDKEDVYSPLRDLLPLTGGSSEAPNWRAFSKPPGPPSPALLAAGGDALRALYALHVALTQFLFLEEEEAERDAEAGRPRERLDDARDCRGATGRNAGSLSEGGEGEVREGAVHQTMHTQEDFCAPTAQRRALDFFAFLRLPLHARLARLAGISRWWEDGADVEEARTVERGREGEGARTQEDQETEEAARVVARLRKGVVLPQQAFDEIFGGDGDGASRGRTAAEGLSSCPPRDALFGWQLHLACPFGGAGRGRQSRRRDAEVVQAQGSRAPSSSPPLTRLLAPSSSSFADFLSCLETFCSAPAPQQVADFCLEVLPWSPSSSTPAASLSSSSQVEEEERGVETARRMVRRSLATVAEVVKASSPLVASSSRLLRRRSDVGEIALCAVYHRASLLPASSLFLLVDRLYDALPQTFEEDNEGDVSLAFSKSEQGGREKERANPDAVRDPQSQGEDKVAEREKERRQRRLLERRKRLRVLAGGADMLEQHLDVVEFLNRHLAPPGASSQLPPSALRALPSTTFQQLKAACLSPGSARLLLTSLLHALCRASSGAPIAGEGDGKKAAAIDLRRATRGEGAESSVGTPIQRGGGSSPLHARVTTCSEFLDCAAYIQRRACAALSPDEFYEILLTTCATEVVPCFARASVPSSSPSSSSSCLGFSSLLHHLRLLAAPGADAGQPGASGASGGRALLATLLDRWREVSLLAGDDAQCGAFFLRAGACLLACARDLTNNAASFSDPALEAARDLLLICAELEKTDAVGGCLSPSSSGADRRRGAAKKGNVEAARLPFRRQAAALSRQVRDELRFLAFIKAFHLLLTSPTVSAPPQPARAAESSSNVKRRFGAEELEAVASAAGSSAKAVMVGAARGGSALALGALEVSGVAASSTLRLLRGASAAATDPAEAAQPAHREETGAPTNERERGAGEEAMRASKGEQQREPMSQQAPRVAHREGAGGSRLSGAAPSASVAYSLASSSWPSTPLHVRLAAAQPGGLARLLRAILRTFPEAADEEALLEELVSLLGERGRAGDGGRRDGAGEEAPLANREENWEGRWRVSEARAWAFFVRGLLSDALGTLAALLVRQQAPLTVCRSGDAAGWKRALRENSDGETEEARSEPQRSQERGRGRRGRRRRLGPGAVACMRRILAEADPSLAVLTLQLAKPRPLPASALAPESVAERAPSSARLPLTFATEKSPPSSFLCLSPNVRGALLALAVRRADARHLPLLLSAFAAVQHGHYELQAALFFSFTSKGERAQRAGAFSPNDAAAENAPCGASERREAAHAGAPAELAATSCDSALRREETGPEAARPHLLHGDAQFQTASSPGRASSSSSSSRETVAADTRRREDAWFPAKSADWFASSDALSSRLRPPDSRRATKGGEGTEARDEAGALAPPGGASSFWLHASKMDGGGASRGREARDPSAWSGEKERLLGGSRVPGTGVKGCERWASASPSCSPPVLTTSLFLRARAALGLSSVSPAAAASGCAASKPERCAAESGRPSRVAEPAASPGAIRPPPVAPAAFVFSAIGVAEGVVNFAASRARQEYDKRLGAFAGVPFPFGADRGDAKNEDMQRGAEAPTGGGGAQNATDHEAESRTDCSFCSSREWNEEAAEEEATAARGSLAAPASSAPAPTASSELVGLPADALRTVKPPSSWQAESTLKSQGEGAAAHRARGGVHAKGEWVRDAEEEAEKWRSLGRDSLAAEPYVLSAIMTSGRLEPLSARPSLLFWSPVVSAKALPSPAEDASLPAPASSAPASSSSAASWSAPSSGSLLLSLSETTSWDLPLLFFVFALLQGEAGRCRSRKLLARAEEAQQTRDAGERGGSPRLQSDFEEGHVHASFQPCLRLLLQADVEAAFLVAALLSLFPSPRPAPASSGPSRASRFPPPGRLLGAGEEAVECDGLWVQGDACVHRSVFPQCALQLLHHFLSSAPDSRAPEDDEKAAQTSCASSLRPSSSLSRAAASAAESSSRMLQARAARFCPQPQVWSGSPYVARPAVATDALLQLLLRWLILSQLSSSLDSVSSPSPPRRPPSASLPSPDAQGDKARSERAESALRAPPRPSSVLHSLFLAREFLQASNVVLELLSQLRDGGASEKSAGRARLSASLCDASIAPSVDSTAGGEDAGEARLHSLLSSLACDGAFRRQLLLGITQAFPQHIDAATAVLRAANALQIPLVDLPRQLPAGLSSSPSLSLCRLLFEGSWAEGEAASKTNSPPLGSGASPELSGAEETRDEGEIEEREREGTATTTCEPCEAVRLAELAWRESAAWRNAAAAATSGDAAAANFSVVFPQPQAGTSAQQALLPSVSPACPLLQHDGEGPGELLPASSLSASPASSICAAAFVCPAVARGAQASGLRSAGPQSRASTHAKKLAGWRQAEGREESREAFLMRLATFEALFLAPDQPLPAFVAELHAQLPLLLLQPSQSSRRRAATPEVRAANARGREDDVEGEGDRRGGVCVTGKWIVRLLRVFAKAMEHLRREGKLGRETGARVHAVKTLLDAEEEQGMDAEEEEERKDEERQALQLANQLQTANASPTGEKDSASSSLASSWSPQPSCDARLLHGVAEKTLFLRTLFTSAAQAAGLSPADFLAEVLRGRASEARGDEEREGEEEAERLEGADAWRGPRQKEGLKGRQERAVRIIQETGLGDSRVEKALSVLLSLLPLVDITGLFLLPPTSAAPGSGHSEVAIAMHSSKNGRNTTTEEGERAKAQIAGGGAQEEENRKDDPFLRGLVKAVWVATASPCQSSLLRERSLALLALLQQGPSVFSRRCPPSSVAEVLLLRHLQARGFAVAAPLFAASAFRDKNEEEESDSLGRSVATNDSEQTQDDLTSLLLAFIPLSRWEAALGKLRVCGGPGASEQEGKAGDSRLKALRKQGTLLILVRQMRQTLERRRGKSSASRRRDAQSGDQENLDPRKHGGLEDKRGEGREDEGCVEPGAGQDEETALRLLRKLRFQEAWLLLGISWDYCLSRSATASLVSSSLLFPAFSSPSSEAEDCGASPHFGPASLPPSPRSSPAPACTSYVLPPCLSSSSSPFSLSRVSFSSPPATLEGQRECLSAACVNVLLYCEASKFSCFSSAFWRALFSPALAPFVSEASPKAMAEAAIEGDSQRGPERPAGTQSLTADAPGSGRWGEEQGGEETGHFSSARADSEEGAETQTPAGKTVGEFVAAGLVPWLQKLYERLCAGEQSRGAAASGDAGRGGKVFLSEAAMILLAHTGHHLQLLLERLEEAPGSAGMKESLFSALAQAVSEWIVEVYRSLEHASLASASVRDRKKDVETHVFCLVLCDSLLQHRHAPDSRGCSHVALSPPSRPSPCSPSQVAFARLELLLLWLAMQSVDAVLPRVPQLDDQAVGEENASSEERETSGSLFFAAHPGSRTGRLASLSLRASSSRARAFASVSAALAILEGDSAAQQTKRNTTPHHGLSPAEEEERENRDEKEARARAAKSSFKARRCGGRAFLGAWFSALRSQQVAAELHDSEGAENLHPGLESARFSAFASAHSEDTAHVQEEARGKERRGSLRLRERLLGLALLLAAESGGARCAGLTEGNVEQEEPEESSGDLEGRDDAEAEGGMQMWVPEAFAAREDGERNTGAERANAGSLSSDERRSEEAELTRSERQCEAAQSAGMSSSLLWEGLIDSASTEEEAILIALFATGNKGSKAFARGAGSPFSSSPALRLLNPSSGERDRTLAWLSSFALSVAPSPPLCADGTERCLPNSSSSRPLSSAAQCAAAWLLSWAQSRARGRGDAHAALDAPSASIAHAASAPGSFGRGGRSFVLNSLLERSHALLLTALIALSGSCSPSPSGSPASSAWLSSAFASVVVATLTDRRWLDALEEETEGEDMAAGPAAGLRRALPDLLVPRKPASGKDEKGGLVGKPDLCASVAGRGGSVAQSLGRAPRDLPHHRVGSHASWRASLDEGAPSASSPHASNLCASFGALPAFQRRPAAARTRAVTAAVNRWYASLSAELGGGGEAEARAPEEEWERRDRGEREELLLAVLWHVLRWFALLRPQLLASALLQQRSLSAAPRSGRDDLPASASQSVEKAQGGSGKAEGTREMARETDQESVWRLTALQTAVEQYHFALAAAPFARPRQPVMRRQSLTRSRAEEEEREDAEGGGGESGAGDFWALETTQGVQQARAGWRCLFPATAWILWRLACECEDAACEFEAGWRGLQQEERGRDWPQRAAHLSAAFSAASESHGPFSPACTPPSALSCVARSACPSADARGAVTGLYGSVSLFMSDSCPVLLAADARRREDERAGARVAFLQRRGGAAHAHQEGEEASVWRHVTERLGEAVQKVSWLL